MRDDYLSVTFVIFISLAIYLLFGFSGFVIAVVPNGANITYVNSTRAPEDVPQSIAAQAGNVTELNIDGYTTTQSWQGYYGNVSGSIQLSDGDSNVMYNWSVSSPSGEVYASINDSINWGSIMCFNYTATGSYNDDSANVGNTSLYGMNLSQIETAYGINDSDSDGVNETFTFIGADTHDTFYTANLGFIDGECQSTRLYTNNGVGENDMFEEVLLYEYIGRSVIFASLLEKDRSGFDGKSHDFEMLVLEDGHLTDTATTEYYFYVEIQ